MATLAAKGMQGCGRLPNFYTCDSVEVRIKMNLSVNNFNAPKGIRLQGTNAVVKFEYCRPLGILYMHWHHTINRPLEFRLGRKTTTAAGTAPTSSRPDGEHFNYCANHRATAVTVKKINIGLHRYYQ